MQVIMCEDIWEWIDVIAVELSWLVWFRNKAFKMLLIILKQKRFLKQLSFFKILKMFGCSWFTKLFFNSVNFLLKIRSPLVYDLMDK